MNITIIGSGNVATILGRLLKANSYTINEVVSRNREHAGELATALGASACDDLTHINQHSDMYIIAVNDDAISEVSSKVSVGEKLVVHTCGSMAMDVLKNVSKNYGVLYPLQSLRKETNYLPRIPFLIDGNNIDTKETIYNFASSVSPQVKEANDGERLQYHLSAVVVSNFTNHLFALAKEYCKVAKIDFDTLLPLIEETVARIYNYEPLATQTGPAIRGDKATIEKHLTMLENFAQLKYIYEVMSESILKFKPARS
jgi:predicted short-subunit dehydrogenase-like oxidoreductase (DUF2520 family)